ncbi:MAG: arginyltransferase [Betaproteobacteria bacterium]|nr:arginyltransferase [Betaproteobacteria bacterium]MDE2622803.1 arginyltransferase [Betaproteobacteria bacterium]
MTRLHDLPLRQLQFYATAPYPCSYLPNLEARSQVVTPGYLVDQHLYSALVDSGFRRSGVFTYRPHCNHCRACVPVRVDVGAFKANRAQRRTWARHAHLEALWQPLRFEEEHYELYSRYQTARHLERNSGLDSQEQYVHFLLQSTVPSQLVEFRENGILRMISIIDELEQGLSSVYTFYDPDLPQASLGTYNILWQIEECRRRNLPWLYLGYWIARSNKMAYKIRFQPLQGLVDQRWIPLSPTSESL